MYITEAETSNPIVPVPLRLMVVAKFTDPILFGALPVVQATVQSLAKMLCR